jgi:hypothetical protein
MFEKPDPELERAMELSMSDPQQAARVLTIAANYLKTRERLPSALSLFLADAFERAMKFPSTSRGEELLRNLKLRVDHRRPKANFLHVGFDIEFLIKKKITMTEATIQVAENYGISEKTAQRRHKEYLDYREYEAVTEDLDQDLAQLDYQQRSAGKDSP